MVLVLVVVRRDPASVGFVENDPVQVVGPANVFVADAEDAFAEHHDVPVVCNVDVKCCGRG